MKLDRRLAIFLAVLVAPSAGVAQTSQIQPAADAPRPHTPRESQKLFRVKEGFRVELVASEPLLADPSGIAWDEDGRIFVCELHGYNLEGHLDVLELNKSGVLDRNVRRIPASPEAKKAARKGTYGTVKRLEDADGDGRMDRAVIWADRLPPCYGLIAARGGLIVVCAPDIVYLADRDDDGDAEVREKLFTGFGVGALERGINSPRWGPDGWIYVAAGRGGTITGPGLADAVQIGNTDFRFRPDGSAIEPVTGGNGTFGMALTDFGERFLLNTSHHAMYAVPLPYRYLTRNPHVPTPRTVADAASYTRIFPTSRPHPWRLARSRDPAWVRFYGSHETSNEFFTSACGQMIYRADTLPVEYRGHHFACDPQSNLVHHSRIERDGAGFKVRRAPDEADRELLTSAEKWFRPNCLVTGPDGAIYIVDMYREIIEDYSAIPRFLQQQYGLDKGADRGRIWRLTHESHQEGRRPSLSHASTAELVRLLEHPNAWWRETAQRLLVARDDRLAIESLRQLVREGAAPPSRLHALYTLDGLAALQSGDVVRALGDPSYGLRLHALRLAGRFLDMSEPVFRTVISMTRDRDPKVRLQLAMTLGESEDPRALSALARLAVDHGEERWMDVAIASSLRSTAAAMLARLLPRPEGPGQARTVIELAAATVGGRRVGTEIAGALTALAASPHLATRQHGLKGLLEGLGRGHRKPVEIGDGVAALRTLLASSSVEVRDRTIEIFRALRLEDSPFLATAFDRAVEDVVNAELSLPIRLASMRFLASAPFEPMRRASERVLRPEEPIELQLGAVAALSAADDDRAGDVLLAAWPGYSPRVQSVVLDAIFARENRLRALLEAFEANAIVPAVLTRFHRLRLLENGDSKVRDRARRLFTTGTSAEDRDEVFREFATALAGPRDALRGELVYRKHCLPCHQLKQEGHSVGPDLQSARGRADETLLNDILAPSREISAGYGNYVVTTVDGRALSGVLASESATSLTLRQAEGVEHRILRRDMAAMSSVQISLMPENFSELLKPREVADVISYLRDAFGELETGTVTLFDDDPKFLRQLKNGDGVATMDTERPFSGVAALSVTPPQRYSDRIPGWTYRITEDPGLDEYRYLRLAWKTRGGRGVMVELAADGRWPDSGSPRRRYYSGTNTTEWQARQITAEVPTGWTVVTVDLWRDNGPFTLTGIAPTAMGGVALFDRIELRRSLDGAGEE